LLCSYIRAEHFGVRTVSRNIASRQAGALGLRRKNRRIAPKFLARAFSGDGKKTPEQGIFAPFANSG